MNLSQRLSASCLSSFFLSDCFSFIRGFFGGMWNDDPGFPWSFLLNKDLGKELKTLLRDIGRRLSVWEGLGRRKCDRIFCWERSSGLDSRFSFSLSLLLPLFSLPSKTRTTKQQRRQQHRKEDPTKPKATKTKPKATKAKTHRAFSPRFRTVFPPFSSVFVRETSNL